MALTSTGMTLADLLERFGAIPAARIRYDPPPGTATEQDVITLEAREKRLFELVDGVLVEKAMGFYESFLAMRLAQFLLAFVERHVLGIVAGEVACCGSRPVWCGSPMSLLSRGTGFPSAGSRGNQFPTSCLTWQSRC